MKKATPKKVSGVNISLNIVTEYQNTFNKIANAQKTLDEINYRMKLRPHPQMKLQMKDSQTKLKKYIREQKTHARELKKLL